MVIVTTSIDVLLDGLPVNREQCIEIILVTQIMQSLENIAHVGVWIDTVPLAGYDDRVYYCRSLTRCGRADKQEVFLTHGRGADRIFDQVVVDPCFTEETMTDQWAPLAQKIIAGFTQI